MRHQICIAAATAIVVLAAVPAYAQTAETVDSVARGGVNSLDERVGALEARTLSSLTCSSGEIAKFNGAVWVCAADDDTDTSAATQCGSGEILTGDNTCVPLPSGASGQGRFQFAGATPSTALHVAGDFGKTNMDNLCANHIPGSRMCTTEEILNTTHGNGQGSLTGKTSGWVHPSIVAVNVLAAGTAADLEATDYSGLTGHPSSELSCDGWSSNSVDKTGLFATNGELGQGNITKIDCSLTGRVACCKLFP